MARAAALAVKPYAPPAALAQEVLERIDYDAHGKIRFKPDLALWADDAKRAYPVTFFHLGRYFRTPVRMHVVEANAAREIIYSESLFDMRRTAPPRSAARRRFCRLPLPGSEGRRLAAASPRKETALAQQ